MHSQSENEHLNAKTSPDDHKTEAVVSVVSSDGPGLGKDGSTADHKFYIPRCAFVFYIMAFLGFTCAFALRVSLSVAIVAMVNQTAIAQDVVTINTSDTDQCPRDPALLREGGEFIWNRHQQGAVLAAFYYGNSLSQV